MVLNNFSRAWYDDIHRSLTNQGYKCMQNESCLFYKHSNKGPTIIALYVDDLIIAGKPEEATEVKDFLNSRYSMKDLGEVNHILRSSKRMYLSYSTPVYTLYCKTFPQ